MVGTTSMLSVARSLTSPSVWPGSFTNSGAHMIWG